MTVVVGSMIPGGFTIVPAVVPIPGRAHAYYGSRLACQGLFLGLLTLGSFGLFRLAGEYFPDSGLGIWISVPGLVFAGAALLMACGMALTLVHWNKARVALSAMKRKPYPAGLTRGRELLAGLNLQSMSKYEDRNGALYAVGVMLREEGYQVNMKMVVLDIIDGLMAVLEEDGRLLTPDGGCTSEVFASRDENIHEVYLRNADESSVYNYELETWGKPILDKMKAQSMADQMDRETIRNEIAPRAAARL